MLRQEDISLEVSRWGQNFKLIGKMLQVSTLSLTPCLLLPWIIGGVTGYGGLDLLSLLHLIPFGIVSALILGIGSSVICMTQYTHPTSIVDEEKRRVFGEKVKDGQTQLAQDEKWLRGGILTYTPTQKLLDDAKKSSEQAGLYLVEYYKSVQSASNATPSLVERERLRQLADTGANIIPEDEEINQKQASPIQVQTIVDEELEEQKGLGIWLWAIVSVVVVFVLLVLLFIFL